MEQDQIEERRQAQAERRAKGKARGKQGAKGAAMILAGMKAGFPGKVFITRPVMRGAYIVRADPSFSKGVVRYPNSV